ncbi:hypothetical protein F4X86_04125 [Candidatus Saccharibacteria bacterium]|nr:hypothetical protein [Candidatus Saccharibacteria bacterium]
MARSASISMVKKLKSRWLPVSLGALAILGIIVSVGFMVSATAPDYEEDDGLAGSAVHLLGQSMVVEVFGHENNLEKIDSVSFILDFGDNPLACGYGNPDRVGMDPQVMAGGRRDDVQQVTTYSVGFHDLAAHLKEAGRLAEGGSYGPAAIEDMVVCVLVTSSSLVPVSDDHPNHLRRNENTVLWKHDRESMSEYNKNLSADWAHLWDYAGLSRLYGKGIEISVAKNNLTFTANSPNRENVTWRNRVIDTGETCGSDDFRVQPNHPAVRASNQRAIPENNLDGFRNRWICFEATDSGGNKTYAFYAIDLGDPVISVSRSGEELLAQADKEVSWRVGRSKNLIVGTIEEPHGRYAGGPCELIFSGSSVASLADFDGTQSLIGAAAKQFRANIVEGAVTYCFEATDSDGNKAYVETRLEEAGQIRSEGLSAKGARYPGQVVDLTVFRPRLYSTSGYVDWTIAGPSHSDLCNAGTFASTNTDPKFSYREDKASVVVRYISSTSDEFLPATPYSYEPRIIHADPYDNKDRGYYCVRAVDQLGLRYYKSL